MLIYASSCPDYFAAHGGAFIASARKHGHTVKVGIIGDDWRDSLKYDNERTYRMLYRYMKLPELLKHDDVLMLDIDSIINAPIFFSPEYDMGLFLRPWIAPHREELKVLMTASWWTRKALPFAERVKERILNRTNICSDDQIEVWRTYEEMKHRFRILQLSEDFACYHFDRDAPVWTCKGPARKDNPVYLEKKALYADL